MSVINTITLDLWQTLILDTKEAGKERTELRLKGTRDVLLRLGEIYDIKDLDKAYHTCYRECHSIRELGVDISFEEQVALFISKVSEGLRERIGESIFIELMQVYSDSFFEYPPVPHGNALEVLAYLKATGCKLGLISNTGMTPGVAFRRFLEEHSMLCFFDVLTFSDEIRLSKPSSGMFMRALKELDSNPTSTVHVGDDLRNDVIGARTIGMKTIWIQGVSDSGHLVNSSSEADVTITDLSLLPSAIDKLRF